MDPSRATGLRGQAQLRSTLQCMRDLPADWQLQARNKQADATSRHQHSVFERSAKNLAPTMARLAASWGHGCAVGWKRDVRGKRRRGTKQSRIRRYRYVYVRQGGRGRKEERDEGMARGRGREQSDCERFSKMMERRRRSRDGRNRK